MVGTLGEHTHMTYHQRSKLCEMDAADKVGEISPNVLFQLPSPNGSVSPLRCSQSDSGERYTLERADTAVQNERDE